MKKLIAGAILGGFMAWAMSANGAKVERESRPVGTYQVACWGRALEPTDRGADHGCAVVDTTTGEYHKAP